MIPDIPFRKGMGGARAKGVLTVRAGETWICILLCHGSEIPGCDVHWLPDLQESRPCVGSKECADCKTGHHPQWKGYAPTLTTIRPFPFTMAPEQHVTHARRDMQTRCRPVALEITGQCWDLQGCAPGTLFVVGRSPGKRNNRLTLYLPDVAPVPVQEGQWFDTTPLVKAMWKHHFQEGVP